MAMQPLIMYIQLMNEIRRRWAARGVSQELIRIYRSPELLAHLSGKKGGGSAAEGGHQRSPTFDHMWTWLGIILSYLVNDVCACVCVCVLVVPSFMFMFILFMSIHVHAVLC